MGKATKQKSLRIEINLSKEDSRIIRNNICRIDETRKEAIQRMVKAQIEKEIKRKSLLIM